MAQQQEPWGIYTRISRVRRKSKDGKVTTVTGEYDLATSSGRLMFRIAGAIARRESEHRGERMALKMDELAQNGKVKGGGIRAFGFERDGKTVNKREADLINEAVDRLLAGESSAALLRD